MLHVREFLSRSAPPPIAATSPRPITPPAYVRLRRYAHDLSIVEVGERLASKAQDQAEARALIRVLETEGVVARHRETLELIATAFPIDPDVYFQLATQPFANHPAICRVCGCSQNDACGGELTPACGWDAPALCTACAGEVRL